MTPESLSLYQLPLALDFSTPAKEPKAILKPESPRSSDNDLLHSRGKEDPNYDIDHDGRDAYRMRK